MGQSLLQRRPVRGVSRVDEPVEAHSIEQLAGRIAEIEVLLVHSRESTDVFDYSDRALASVAARVYSGRRRRDRYFDSAIFADPAWDMLLDLFIAHAQGKRLRTVSLCIASGVPATTALRWIGVLEGQGLIERSQEDHDQRAKIKLLTIHGYRVMRKYLIASIEAREMPTVGGFA